MFRSASTIQYKSVYDSIIHYKTVQRPLRRAVFQYILGQSSTKQYNSRTEDSEISYSEHYPIRHRSPRSSLVWASALEFRSVEPVRAHPSVVGLRVRTGRFDYQLHRNDDDHSRRRMTPSARHPETIHSSAPRDGSPVRTPSRFTRPHPGTAHSSGTGVASVRAWRSSRRSVAVTTVRPRSSAYARVSSKDSLAIPEIMLPTAL